MNAPYYRTKLTAELPHYRCEAWLYTWFRKTAKEFNMTMGELQRLAADEFARSGWPKGRGGV